MEICKRDLYKQVHYPLRAIYLYRYLYFNLMHFLMNPSNLDTIINFVLYNPNGL